MISVAKDVMDNSAARLLRLIEAGMLISGEVKCTHAWCELLDVQEHRLLPGKLSHVFSLIHDAANEVLRLHPDELDSVQHWQNCFFSAFYNFSLGSKWSDFIQRIDRHAINSLRSHSKLINADAPAKVIEEEKLATIRQHLTIALEKIGTSGFDEQTKRTLIIRIEQLISCINCYRFVGQQAALDAATLLLAEVSILPEEVRTEVKSSSVFESVKDALSVLANSVQVVSSYPQIAALGTNIIKAMS